MTPPTIAVEGIQGTRLVAEDAVVVDLTLRNQGEAVFDPRAVGSVFLACAPDGANAVRDRTPSAGNTLDRTITIDPGESRTLRYTNRSNGVYSVADADFAYLLVGPPAAPP